MATNDALNRKLRMALCGGGQGSFIGRVHCTAAVLDNRAALVAGALSSNPKRAKASAPDYDIPSARAYGSYQQLFDTEKSLPEGERIDFVSVATPNHTHFEIAKAAVEAGFNVICDKPMTFDLAQAEELASLVDNSNVVFAVSHNYTGYPLVRQAREMILGGELGEINAVRSNYIQGWLRTRLEAEEQKQASWRTDPTKSGAAGCFGDIATHAYNLGRYMTGLLPAENKLPPQDLRRGAGAGRLRYRCRSVRKWRFGHGHRFADLTWSRKRPLYRNRRNEGVAVLASGKPQRNDRSLQWQAAPNIHT